MLRNSSVFDIGDEDSLNGAVAHVMWFVDRHSYLSVVPKHDEPYGMILYNRGSLEYYHWYVEPRIELLHDVAEKLSFIGFLVCCLSLLPIRSCLVLKQVLGCP
jgi:hypothetical protein